MLTRRHFSINENFRAMPRVLETCADTRQARADDMGTAFVHGWATIAKLPRTEAFLNADQLCLLAAGIFFSSGLLTGWWKYRCISVSPKAVAPVYVDIAHRASLMYAFSALLLREFVPYSPLSPTGTLWAAGLPLLFFALAISGYIVHGILRDTDSQLRRPHKLGNAHLPNGLITLYMVALIVGEVGGFLVLFAGFLKPILAA